MPKEISSAWGREFGEGLRAAIKGAGLSGHAIAEIVGWHESKISNLVQGKGGASEQDVIVLLGACRVLPAERDHLLMLFREANIRGWWQQHGSHGPVRLRTMIHHLRIAESVVSWQAHVVPYFLRTSNYMRAMTLASVNIPPDELDSRVEVQAEVQKMVWSRPCTFYIHESALMLPVGGSDVHADQLSALLFAADLPMINIRIVPFGVGAHAGLSGSFTKLAFRKYEPLVWLENENSDLFVESPAAIKGYETIAHALDRVCLDIESSKLMIARMVAAPELTRPFGLAAQSCTQ